MNTRPTYGTTAPIETGPFNRYDHRNKTYQKRYAPKTIVLPDAFNAPDHVQPAAVAALTRAFLLAKTSHRAWKSYKREGRLDPRRAAGAVRGEQDIFKRRAGRSTTKVRVSVLIDASGSMRFGDTALIPMPDLSAGKRKIKVTNALAAAIFGCTIAKALGRIPTVDLDVFQHATGGETGGLLLKWRWHRGTPLGAFNESVWGIGGGGNADGHALYAITERMLHMLKRDERGIIMVVSDGLPSDYGQGGDSNAGQALIDAVAYARKQGIEVIGVAIDGSDQSDYYGDGTVEFTSGNWVGLGSDLAKHVGKALAS